MAVWRDSACLFSGKLAAHSAAQEAIRRVLGLVQKKRARDLQAGLLEDLRVPLACYSYLQGFLSQ